MLTTDGPFVINPHIFRKLDYTPADFTPVAGVADFDLGLGVGPKLPEVRDMKQFMAWARGAKAVAYGSPGNGTLPHFSGAALGQALGIETTHVPYKGGTPAAQDLAGGQVPFILTSVNDMIELHRAGKIRIVAVAGEKRSPVLPEVPTMLESGVQVSGSVKIGIYGPAGMPPALVKQLEQAVLAAVRLPDVQQKLLQNSMVPAPLGGEALAAAARVEVRRLEPIVKASGYQPE
ncbi:tripartite tricarboxylate transporter substrate-binding protein [Piscinibacter sakaiensis]